MNDGSPEGMKRALVEDIAALPAKRRGRPRKKSSVAKTSPNEPTPIRTSAATEAPKFQDAGELSLFCPAADILLSRIGEMAASVEAPLAVKQLTSALKDLKDLFGYLPAQERREKEYKLKLLEQETLDAAGAPSEGKIEIRMDDEMRRYAE